MFFNKRIFLILGLLLCTFMVFSTEKSIKDVVNPKYYDELILNDFVMVITTEKDIPLELIPESIYKEKCLQNKVEKKEKKYAFAAEGLYILKKEDLKKTNKENANSLNTRDVSKIFRMVSTMKGIEYYSKNRKKTDILYKDVYMVDNPNDRNRIPDDKEGNSDGKIYYVLQNDATFGKALYRLNYYESEDVFYGVFTNIDSMGIGFVKAVSPGDMRVNTVVMDMGDSFLLYLGIDTNCTKFINIKKTLENCLTSRIDALKKWFMNSFD